jgi:hypothetical protein
MLTPNMTMAVAYRPSEIGFFENQFLCSEIFFSSNDFLMCPDYRTCRVGHENLSFVYLNEFLDNL